MKLRTLLCPVALVGAIGCSGPAPGPTAPIASTEIEMPAETTTVVGEDGTAITWVRLKVPNMF